MSEISENGLTLKLPANSCALGHMLIMTIIKGMKPPNPNLLPPLSECSVLTVTAKVISIEPIDQHSKTVGLQFYQFDQIAWNRFLDMFQMRQEFINDVFKKIKGGDE